MASYLHRRVNLDSQNLKIQRTRHDMLFQMGEEVMVSPEVQDKDLAKLFPRGVEKVRMPSGIAYVRKTRDYGQASECWDGSII